MPKRRAGPRAGPAALALLLVLPAAAGALAADAGPPSRARAAGIDPLPELLTDDWDAEKREAVGRRVRDLGGAACATLSGYAGARDPRTREHAVRALADAGCDQVEDYRDFFRDGSAWVVDALIDAVARHRIAAAIPFLLDHLDDPRRLVSDAGTWSLEAEAHRALRRITAQPIPFDPSDPAAARRRAAAAWRAWYAGARDQPPARWLASGLERARAALEGDAPRRRLAALDTLAVLGEAGRPLLARTLARAPGAIEAGLLCQPEEPPRVVDRVPCTFTLRNVSPRRVALALGVAGITLVPEIPAAAPAASDRRKSKRREGAGRHPAPPAEPAAFDSAALSGRFVDLAPGEVLTRNLEAGPAPSAGHYLVRADVADLARPLLGAHGSEDSGPLEATTRLRFEQ